MNLAFVKFMTVSALLLLCSITCPARADQVQTATIGFTDSSLYDGKKLLSLGSLSYPVAEYSVTRADLNYSIYALVQHPYQMAQGAINVSITSDSNIQPALSDLYVSSPSASGIVILNTTQFWPFTCSTDDGQPDVTVRPEVNTTVQIMTPVLHISCTGGISNATIEHLPDDNPMPLIKMGFSNIQPHLTPALALSWLRFEQPAGVKVQNDKDGLPIFSPGQPARAVISYSGTNLLDDGSSVSAVFTDGNDFDEVMIPVSELISGTTRSFDFTPNPIWGTTLQAGIDVYNEFPQGNANQSDNEISQDFSFGDSYSVNINNVRLAQVVYDPNIDGIVTLVQGKSSSIEVTLDQARGDSKSHLFNLVVSNNGKILTSTKSPVDLLTVQNSGSFVVKADKFNSFITPELISIAPVMPYLTITVVPVEAGTKISSNIFLKPVSSVKTYAPQLAFIPIQGCENLLPCYKAVKGSDLSFGIKQLWFISEIFPFADNSVKGFVLTDSITGSGDKTKLANPKDPKKLLKVDRGVTADALALEVRKMVKANPNDKQIDRLFGVVPEDYFSFHNLPSYHGLAYAKRIPVTKDKSSVVGKVALIEANFVQSLPHELGHTYGYIKHDEFGTDSYNITEGYNAIPDAFSPDKSGGHFSSVMGSDADHVTTDLDFLWANPSSYNAWLETAITPIVDPKIMYVAGLLGSDGTFKVTDSGVAEGGFLTPSEAGDLRIAALDTSGKVVNEISLSSDLIAIGTSVGSNSGGTELTSDFVPIFAALPFDSTISTLRISRNGQIISRTKIASLTIKEIIKSIPMDAYKFSPWASQYILLLEADCIQRAIDKHASPKEIVKLLNFMESEIRLGLKDKYPVSGLNQLGKMDVIEDIEAIKGKFN